VKEAFPKSVSKEKKEFAETPRFSHRDASGKRGVCKTKNKIGFSPDINMTCVVDQNMDSYYWG